MRRSVREALSLVDTYAIISLVLVARSGNGSRSESRNSRLSDVRFI
jgi:hypothetical protein